MTLWIILIISLAYAVFAILGIGFLLHHRNEEETDTDHYNEHR